MSYKFKTLCRNIEYKRDLFVMHNALFLREIKIYFKDIATDISDILKYSYSASICYMYIKKESFINTFFRSFPDKWSN